MVKYGKNCRTNASHIVDDIGENVENAISGRSNVTHDMHYNSLCNHLLCEYKIGISSSSFAIQPFCRAIYEHNIRLYRASIRVEHMIYAFFTFLRCV